MNTEPQLDTTEQIRRLFDKAQEYAALAIENLVLEPESTVHFDRFVERHAFAIRGLPAEWERTPSLALELRRDAHIVHFLFPNLTDEERDVLLQLRNACHLSRVYRSASTEANSPGWEKWLATRCIGDIEERLSDCRIAFGVLGIEHKLTTAQLQLLDSDYFDPDSKLVSN